MQMVAVGQVCQQSTILLPLLLLSERNPLGVAPHAVAPLVSVPAFPPGTAGDQGFYLPQLDVCLLSHKALCKVVLLSL